MLVYGIFNAWIDIEYQTYFERLQYVENFNWAEHETNSFRELCLFFIGPIVGSIFFGYVAMKFGRRASLIYMAIPMIVSYPSTNKREETKSKPSIIAFLI